MILKVTHNPDYNFLSELYFLSGENCHLNPKVLQANSVKGTTPLVLRICREGQTVAYGVARESNRWFTRKLVFPILPQFIEKSEKVTDCFWKGLQEYCQRRRVYRLDLNAFNSSPIEVPNLSSMAKITNRKEYILDLKEIQKYGKKGLSSNHRRNILKGERAGLSNHIRKDFEACMDHGRMTEHSMRRRQKRGQSVYYEPSPKKWLAYLQCEAGFIMQAKRDKACVSSLLILQSSQQAYYISGGTSPEGMQLGAAHFLMWKVIEHLSSKGVPLLNLGGVSEKDMPGLARFKAGFGSIPIELPHRSFVMGNPWRHRIIKAINMLK